MDIITLSFLLLNALLPAHEIPLATYDLQLKNNELELVMVFDQGDFEKALLFDFNRKSLPYYHFRRNNLVKKYLKRHLKWTINDQEASVSFQKITLEDHHYEIKAVFSDFGDAVQKIGIYNSCLVDVIEDHSNLIYAHLNGKTRGFRLHKDRMTTFINYSE